MTATKVLDVLCLALFVLFCVGAPLAVFILGTNP